MFGMQSFYQFSGLKVGWISLAQSRIISVTKPLGKPFKYHFQKRAGCYYRLVYIQVHNTVIHDLRAENVSDIEEEIAWRFAMETDCSLGYL